MKKIMLFCCVAIISAAYGQNTSFVKYITNKNARLVIPTNKVIINVPSSVNKQDAALDLEAKNYLLKNTKELLFNEVSLKLTNSFKSLIGTHFQFIQMYRGAVIFQSNIKISLNNNHEIINIVNDLVDLTNIKLPKYSINENEIWAFDGTELIPSTTKIVGNKEQIISTSNMLIYEYTKSVGSGKKDTSVWVKLFNPDPLTTARSPYVAPYLNYNKQDSPALNNERKDVELNLIYDDFDQTFIAENKYVLIQDIFGPLASPFALKNKDSLVVTRNTDIFKQEMVMYHIDRYQNYLQGIGINNLQNKIKIDPIGGFGEDSRFEFSGPEPFLIFAVGGIPDAEDADVIIHEYTHALSFYAAPNTIEGEERIGIDEGNCDIMAAIYSRKLSDYNWRDIFNWDGNTWGGRTTLNTKNYKDDYKNERYALSLIWSGAVTDIAEQIGLDTTVKLLYAAIASLQTNMTIPTFAQLFIQADSILFNKKNTYIINNSFYNRKIIQTLSLNEKIDASSIKILNTQGFASENELLSIQVPASNFNVSIYNLQGKEIYTLKNQKLEASINPNELTQGIYILNITVGNTNFNYKIAKY